MASSSSEHPHIGAGGLSPDPESCEYLKTKFCSFEAAAEAMPRTINKAWLITCTQTQAPKRIGKRGFARVHLHVGIASLKGAEPAEARVSQVCLAKTLAAETTDRGR